ncbi:MAG: DUF4129 domain-containing protein [Candidatus Heimdallarchaeota archaeon]|nr:MAG: DUF4129 domain-containing protein [Candidatus Heimdallarchaeota archaeon]
MNTKDFEFIFQQEFLILCLLLLSLTFAQISLGQQSGNSLIKPFLILNNSLFEILGIFLPLFTGIYVFFSNRSKSHFSFPPLIMFIGIVSIAILLFGFLAPSIQPEEEAPIWPETNASMPISTQIVTESTQPPPTPVDTDQPDSISFFDLLLGLRSFFFIILLFLLPSLIILSRRKSVLKETVVVDNDKSSAVRQKPHGLRTVLECYYQASTNLEERGANSSPSFTPTEFTEDVVTKILTSPPWIETLTDLFEEAKFSNHDITDQKVDQAKSLASNIIFSSDSLPNLKESKESEEIE